MKAVSVFMVKIKKTRKYGRGIFASEDIKKGQAVEVSPLLVFKSKKDLKRLMKTDLCRYLYDFKGKQALALGIGSLFNHSSSANVDWKVLHKEEKILFWASENIKKGQQLFIDYGYDPRVYL